MTKGKTFALLSKEVPSSMKERLADFCDGYIEVEENPNLDPRVACHGDMQLLWEPKTGRLIHAPDVSQKTLEACREKGIQCIEGEEGLGKKYPENIKYNILMSGSVFFHRWDASDGFVKRYLFEQGYKGIHISQGYSHCSSIFAGGKMLVSSDSGLLQETEAENLQTLRIKHGHIQLEGFTYGFIGGATGIDERKKRLFFTGDFCGHPDGRQMEAFFRQNGYQVIGLSDQPLTDYGGICFAYSE